MCKSSLEKIVLDKFSEYRLANTKKDFKQDIKPFENLESIKEYCLATIEKKQVYKDILKSIRICDPAVGSGHFLVSGLNAMCEIYSKLGLLSNDLDLAIKVKNDELEILQYGKPFAYTKPTSDNGGLESKIHLAQKELFFLKKDILENNLFGVDINPNSCNIANLRLWLELLESSYYLELPSNGLNPMQTLPNIDINIKCGNSLISRFMLTSELKEQEKQIQTYKKYVQWYKEPQEYKLKIQGKQIGSVKKMISDELDSIKQNFAYNLKEPKLHKKLKDSINKHLKKYGREQDKKESFMPGVQLTIDGIHCANEEALNSLIKIQELKTRLDFALSGEAYKDAFEWRFEFPEVLDSSGDFKGFDLIIGNPPYIRQEEIKELKSSLQKQYKSFYNSTADIYTYFFNLGHSILKQGGILSFITSNKYCRARYGENLREFLLKDTQILSYVELNGLKVFDSATVDTSILSFKKPQIAPSPTLTGDAKNRHVERSETSQSKESKQTKPTTLFLYTFKQNLNRQNLKELPLDKTLNKSKIAINSLSKDAFIFLNKEESALKAKIEQIGTPLKEWDISINYGIKTGYNEAFIIDTATRNKILSKCEGYPGRHVEQSETSHNKEKTSTQNNLDPSALPQGDGISEFERTKALIKPILRGRDIKRYSYQWAGLWVINFHNGYTKIKIPPLDIADYPALKAYLDKFYPKLQARSDKGDTPYNLRNCAYLEEFAKPKIVWNPVSGEYFFTYLKEQMYFNNSLFMMTQANDKDDTLLYILGLMNSALYQWLMTKLTNLVETGQYAYGAKDKIEKLPIPKINAKQEQEFISLVKEIVDSKRHVEPTGETSTSETYKSLESKLDSMVFALYGLNDKEIALVRGGGNILSCLLATYCHCWPLKRAA